MNKRVKELAEQAGFRSDVTVSDGQGDHIITKIEERLEKFAELIVQECAKLADEPTSRPYESYGEKIKKHFGVK